MNGADPSTNGTGQRPSRRDTAKARWFEAGLDVWMGRGARHFGGGSVREVARAAGRSKSAFENLFPSMDAFRAEAFDWVLLSVDDVAHLAAAMHETAAAMRAGAEPVPLLRALARGSLTRYLDVPAERRLSRALLVSAAMAEDDEAGSEALRRAYGRIADLLVPGYEAILDAWGRTLRDPWSPRSLSIALTSVSDGAMLRALYDPEVMNGEAFADLVLAMIVGATAEAGDEDDFDAWCEAHLLPAPVPPSDDGWEAVFEPIATAASARYRSGGWAAVTMDETARAAGLSRAHLDVAIPFREVLAPMVWGRCLFPALQAEATRRRATVGDPLERVVVGLEALADAAWDHHELTVAMMQAIGFASAHLGQRSAIHLVAPVPALIAPDLAAARDVGQLDPVVIPTHDAAIDLGGHVVNSLMLRALTRPQETGPAAHRFVCLTTLAGAVADRAALQERLGDPSATTQRSAPVAR